MLTALRQQVQQVLYALPAMRRPALRRSDAGDALFATDLPQVAEASAVEAFRRGLSAKGWTIGERKGWLTLDAPIPVPAYSVPQNLCGEIGCCISLLLRHPDDAPAEDLIRAVVKAEDAGAQPLDRLCGQLHGDFAARLRSYQPLPGALLPYLCRAAMKEAST